jgi:hypothetical protein
MLAAILIPLVIAAALLLAMAPDRKGRLIARTPYNNPHDDAAGARDDYRA